jgi:acylphosphatase
MKQLRAIVTGRVQGVSNRADARNLPDGTVEVAAAGAEEDLNKLLSFLHHGPTLARVEGVEVDWTDQTRLEKGFEVRY